MSAQQEDERNRRKPGDAPTTSNNNPACDQCRTRKIRCDRESPSCSNCRKANLPCDFTNKGKRINHTKQLVEDFSFLSGRLESIDASIARITQRLDLENASGVSPISQANPAVPTDDLTHFTRHSSPVGTIEPSESASVTFPSTKRNSYYIVRDHEGAETYHGPTAGRSLFQQTRFYVEDLLDSIKHEDDSDADEDFQRIQSLITNCPTAKTELRKCNDTFPFGAVSPGIGMAHDGRLVSRPPQSFIESALDLFFEEVNTNLPIFDEQHLRSVIKEQYSSARTTTTDAWNLVFNNIVVMVMSMKLKNASFNNIRRKDLEDDIFLPFLSTSYRAFNCIGDYLSARLVNIQALITLALVAADHFPHGVFEALVHKACALGREMGLERYIGTASPAPSAITIERRRVFWALYVLDKRRTFLTGKPCDFYLAESDLETPKFVRNEMWAKNSLARIHMMSIWEEIWKNLYSSRAMRNSPKFREEQIERLRSYLKSWVTFHKPILEKPEQVELGNATCMRLELRYSFHVAQILVHRCLDKPDNLQQQINNARAALKIIKDVAQGTPTISGIGLIARLFRSYPILPFYEIHRRTMREVDDESKEDMELLQSCIDALTIFRNLSQPKTYFNKLGVGFEWCMKIAKILRSVQESSPKAILMSRSVSLNKVMGSPPSRKMTGKRDSESADDGSPSSADSRTQRRRTTITDIPASNNFNGMNTASTSQNGSAGPDTPASGYFSDFNAIDPFGVDQKLSTFATSQLTTPQNEPTDFALPSAHMQTPSLAPGSFNDNKDVYGMNFAFNFPAPAGTINPARAANLQAASRPASTPASPRTQSADLTSLMASLPPGSQHALTALPPSASFAPDTFSTFSTDLLDDSFSNVGHHPDLTTGHHFPHFGFDFAQDHIGFGPLDSMMNVDSL